MATEGEMSGGSKREREDASGSIKHEGALDDENAEGYDMGDGEGGGTKYRRHNVERHLAAERDRRKATKNKVIELDEVLPQSTSGPRTLNQSLAVAIDHIGAMVRSGVTMGGVKAGPDAQNTTSVAHAMVSSPTMGVAVLDRDWKVLQVNNTMDKFLGSENSRSLRGTALLSLIHPPDISALADLLSRLSRSSSPGGDKVFLNLRFQGIGRSMFLDGRPTKVDIVSVQSGVTDKLQMLLVYLGPSLQKLQQQVHGQAPLQHRSSGVLPPRQVRERERKRESERERE